MALINCPECGKEISDTNKKCPQCGFKLKNSKEHEKKHLKKWDKIFIGAIIALGVFAIVIIVCVENAKLSGKELQEVKNINENISRELSVDISSYDKEKLRDYIIDCKSISNQYGQLRWGQKIKIKKYSKIKKQQKTAQNQLNALQNDSINNVIKLIGDIDNVTLESEKQILEAETAYLALEDAEKGKVKNYDILVSKKTDFEIQLIESIDVSLDNDSGTKLELARNIYNGLPEDAQGKVSNFSVLIEKGKKYDKLEDKKENLQIAISEMKEGNLNIAQRHLKKLPDDFSYKTYKVSTLKKNLQKNSQWMKICGEWTTTGGKMEVKQTSKSSGSSTGWHHDFKKNETSVYIRCKVNDDGTVKIIIKGAIPIFTDYSIASVGLDFSETTIDVSKKITQMGTIKVDKYTTLTLSATGITVSYYKYTTNEDIYFNYTYSTNMSLNKRKEKY